MKKIETKSYCETCTFSRALHLMRYGGRTMKALDDKQLAPSSIKVIDGELYHKHSGILETWIKVDFISSEYLMGSWVEVKDEKC